jgi:hypothetical protein
MTTLHLDLHVLYDLDGQTMSFAPADCASVWWNYVLIWSFPCTVFLFLGHFCT